MISGDERENIHWLQQTEREGGSGKNVGEREPNEDPYSLAIEIFLMSEETRRERERERMGEKRREYVGIRVRE